MPPHSLVTSRDAGKRTHWALVCRSETPIDAQRTGDSFRACDVVNIERRTPLGGSQVTAAVEHAPKTGRGASTYQVRFRAGLIAPTSSHSPAPSDSAKLRAIGCAVAISRSSVRCADSLTQAESS
jgi:hypothetical protein